MNTYELLSCLRIKETYGTLPENINAIHQDSRKVSFNSLFVCIDGYTVDGHNYCNEAIKKGASIVLAERKLSMDYNKVPLIVVDDTKKALAILANKFYSFPSTKMTLFGVRS